jgi:hypothetical protein
MLLSHRIRHNDASRLSEWDVFVCVLATSGMDRLVFLPFMMGRRAVIVPVFTWAE